MVAIQPSVITGLNTEKVTPTPVISDKRLAQNISHALQTIDYQQAIQLTPTQAGKDLANQVYNATHINGRTGLSDGKNGEDEHYTPGVDGRCLEAVDKAMIAIGIHLPKHIAIPYARQAIPHFRAHAHTVEITNVPSLEAANNLPIGTIAVIPKKRQPTDRQEPSGHTQIYVGKGQWVSDMNLPAYPWKTPNMAKSWAFFIPTYDKNGYIDLPTTNIAQSTTPTIKPVTTQQTITNNQPINQRRNSVQVKVLPGRQSLGVMFSGQGQNRVIAAQLNNTAGQTFRVTGLVSDVKSYFGQLKQSQYISSETHDFYMALIQNNTNKTFQALASNN